MAAIAVERRFRKDAHSERRWLVRPISRKKMLQAHGRRGEVDMNLHRPLTLLIAFGAIASQASAQEKPVVGLIPKAPKPFASASRRTLTKKSSW